MSAIGTFTMDKPYKTTMKFKIEFLAEESTGTLEDFEVNLPPSGIEANGSPGYLLLTAPAHATSKVFTVTGLFDELAHPGKTLKFKISAVAELETGYQIIRNSSSLLSL